MRSYYFIQKEYYSKYNEVCKLFFAALKEYCKSKKVIESNSLFFDKDFHISIKEANEAYKNANYLKTGNRTWDLWTGAERWDSIFRNLVKREFLIDEGNDTYVINEDRADVT